MIITFAKIKEQIKHHLKEADKDVLNADTILRHIEDNELRERHEALLKKLGNHIDRAFELVDRLS